MDPATTASAIAVEGVPPGGVEQLFGYGVLGVMFVLVMLGYLVPKWVVDEYRKRIEKKDLIIERLTAAVEKLADRFEEFRS